MASGHIPGGTAQVPIMGAQALPEITAGSLTQGFPDPESIEEQKVAYSKSLDMQFEQGSKSLQMQNDERKRLLHQAAEQRKQTLILQVDQQMRMQEMLAQRSQTSCLVPSLSIM